MKKGIIVFFAISAIGFSVPKKVFKSENLKKSKQEISDRQPSSIKFSGNGRKQVPEEDTKVRKININDLKQRFFKERVEIYKKTPKSSLEIFKQFDVAFINFFNAASEKEQTKYSKQLNDLVIKYNGMFSKPIPNEYFLCEEILNIFSVKNFNKTR